jgi:hypothetical protein
MLGAFAVHHNAVARLTMGAFTAIFQVAMVSPVAGIVVLAAIASGAHRLAFALRIADGATPRYVAALISFPSVIAR